MPPCIGVVAGSTSTVDDPIAFWGPIGPSIVLLRVLGSELVCGDCASSESNGGVLAGGTVDVSSCVGEELSLGFSSRRLRSRSSLIIFSMTPSCLP